MSLQEMMEAKLTKKKVAKAINDAVDIPMISEKTEGKIANKVVDIVFNTLLDIIG